MYIFSTGIIDDVKELVEELSTKEWPSLPLQIHLISLAPNHLAMSDQDSAALGAEADKLNAIAGWPQF